jgi:ABC-type antimicrobial peptide transport system ATPase subunit
LGPDGVDMLVGLWHKLGKNGEVMSRMIKMFVSSIRPMSARIMIEERLLEHESNGED